MSTPRPVGKPSYAEVIAGRRRELIARCAGILPAPGSHVLEIGSGHGHFLTAYAQHHPHQLCIGIDLLGDRVERALRKQVRAGLSNLHFLHAEVSLYLECIPKGARLREVFILFPDPWPKLRHHKHRLIKGPLLAALAQHSAPNCRLYFRTDFLPYHEASAEVFAVSEHWEVADEPWPFEFETVFQSRAPAHYSFVVKLRA